MGWRRQSGFRQPVLDPLPKPVSSGCLTVMIREVTTGRAATAIADLAVMTEIDGPQAVDRLLADLAFWHVLAKRRRICWPRSVEPPRQSGRLPWPQARRDGESLSDRNPGHAHALAAPDGCTAHRRTTRLALGRGSHRGERPMRKRSSSRFSLACQSPRVGHRGPAGRRKSAGEPDRFAARPRVRRCSRNPRLVRLCWMLG